MLGCGLVLLATLVGGALVWLYTPEEQRAALVAKYAGPPSVFLDVAGVRLHVRDTGPRTAPAVIFLHGFARACRPGRIGRAIWNRTTGSSATIYPGSD
jgi:hypothetical protein